LVVAKIWSRSDMRINSTRETRSSSSWKHTSEQREQSRISTMAATNACLIELTYCSQDVVINETWVHKASDQTSHHILHNKLSKNIRRQMIMKMI
jgi:hypothetical protein